MPSATPAASACRPMRSRAEAVEQRRVARLHPHRQHRRAAAAGETHEAAPPARVAHAARPQPRHLAGREHDHAFLVLQRPLDRAHAVRAGTPAQHAQRQQQVRQRFDQRQHVVGDDAHVAPHPADEIQQRQRVQRPRRMVGDHQQPPGRRDAGRGAVVGLVAQLQVPQRGGDEREPAQVRMAGEEAVDRVEARPARHPAQQWRGDAATAAAEPVRIALLQALFQSRHGHTRRRPVRRHPGHARRQDDGGFAAGP